jgi:hypothetical protein
MGKNVLCREFIEALRRAYPHCPLPRQCDIFSATCNAPTWLVVSTGKDTCRACTDPEASRPYDCYCDPPQEECKAKAKHKRKRGK